MKQGKRHILTLALPEESGQCLGIGQGGTPVGIFQQFTADVPTRGNESTRADPKRRLVSVFKFQLASLIPAILLSEW
jgi:hypothetical protein